MSSFNFSYILLALCFFSFLTGCDIFDKITTTSTTVDSTPTTKGNSSGTTSTTLNLNSTGVFVYYKNSNFTFVIKDGVTNVSSALMKWTVTNFDEQSGVATISSSLDPSSTTALSPTFYFRKTSSTLLEYSSDSKSWISLINPGSSTVNFLFGTKAAKPSSLLGNVVNSNSSSSVSYVDGSATGYCVSSAYNWSGQDRYSFTEYSKNYYCKDVGFTRAESFTSDMSSLPAYTYKRIVELCSYKIYLPDGGVKEGGETKPEAPSNLAANYTYRYRRYVMKTYSGYWETISYMTLSWSDNSDNEIKFNLYMKATDGNYYKMSEFTDANYLPDSFNSNTTSGQAKIGYYCDWGSGTYSFKLTAATASDESDFSNVATVTVP